MKVWINPYEGAEKQSEKVETSALVPQVIKVKNETVEDAPVEEEKEDENAGLTLMEIHKKKMEKENAAPADLDKLSKKELKKLEKAERKKARREAKEERRKKEEEIQNAMRKEEERIKVRTVGFILR